MSPISPSWKESTILPQSEKRSKTKTRTVLKMFICSLEIFVQYYFGCLFKTLLISSCQEMRTAIRSAPEGESTELRESSLGPFCVQRPSLEENVLWDMEVWHKI